MRKIFALVGFVFVSTLAFSQAGSFTPYSRIGIGELYKNRVGISRGMGGAALALRSNRQINFANPASYSSVDSATFIFQVGISEKFSQLQTSNQKSSGNNFNIEYLSMQFPITKWWASSIGLIPFSSVGYDINYAKEEYFGTDTIQSSYNYYGNGGVNKLYFGHSIELFKRLSLGANFSYLFGANVISSKAKLENVTLAYTYLSNDTLAFGDLYFDFGLQYSQPLMKNKYNLVLGAVFSNKDKISAYKSKYVSIVYGNEYPVLTSNHINGDVELPLSYGAGLSFTDNKHILVSADFYQQKWSQTLSFGQSDSLADSQLICFGAEYTPTKEIISKYWKRIQYRTGVYMSNTYMQIAGNQINDFGISFGVGLPIKRSKSMFNINFEMGKKGSVSNGLIKENYYGLSLNLSLIDSWFNKRKID